MGGSCCDSLLYLMVRPCYTLVQPTQVEIPVECPYSHKILYHSAYLKWVHVNAANTVECVIIQVPGTQYSTPVLRSRSTVRRLRSRSTGVRYGVPEYLYCCNSEYSSCRTASNHTGTGRVYWEYVCSMSYPLLSQGKYHVSLNQQGADVSMYNTSRVPTHQKIDETSNKMIY
jgi:hypothetical protein